jgi:hypothetical protein
MSRASLCFEGRSGGLKNSVQDFLPGFRGSMTLMPAAEFSVLCAASLVRHNKRGGIDSALLPFTWA